jgi:hypothetical protein
VTVVRNRVATEPIADLPNPQVTQATATAAA